MATVVADMSVSLDGFVAEVDGGVERVFAWYGKPQPESQPREGRSEPGASGLRVIVAGRRTFEQAEGWGGQAPHRRAGDRRHPQDSRGLAARGRGGVVCHRGNRDRDEAGRGDRR